MKITSNDISQIKRLQPSGLNHLFNAKDLGFDDYVLQMREIVEKTRVDLQNPHQEKIINANSPCEWRPSNPAKIGVLLIHGLFDSPTVMQSLFDHFKARNFLVRSVLLPGHGT